MSLQLTENEEKILVELHPDSEMCVGYRWLEGQGIERKELEQIIKHFKELDFIEFHRGLMTDDGDVAGSGWCRSVAGNNYIDEHNL